MRFLAPLLAAALSPIVSPAIAAPAAKGPVKAARIAASRRKNGMRFGNRYCRVVYFKDEVIVAARAYPGSAMVSRLFEENPIA